MRRPTFALILSLVVVAAVLMGATPVLAQQVSYPDPPASQVSYVGSQAAYQVVISMPGPYPQVAIDFSGALPSDGNAPANTWIPGNDSGASGTLDGGLGILHGSAGGVLANCSTMGCAYTAPYAGWWGSETFVLSAIGTVCDDPSSGSGDNVCGGGSGIYSQINVTIAVYPPPPVDYDGSINTGYGLASTVTLPISGVLSSAWIVSGPGGGQASVSGQQVTYTPNPGFYGADSFTYQSNGPGGNGNVATISVSVARPPPPSTSGASIDTPYGTPGSVTLPAAGIVSSYGVVSWPSHGSLGISGSTATYTPSGGYYGPDSFVFDASGPGGTSNGSVVSINVGLPPAPVAQNSALTVAYNTAGSVGLTATGDVTGYALAARPSHGTVTLSGGAATYTPATGYIGPDSFTFTAAGPGGNSTGMVTVTVNPPPPPVVNSAPLTCAYQTVCSVTLTTSGVISTLTLKDPGANGTCSLSGDILTYSPAWGAVGADTCTFVASGPGGTSNPATVYVTNEPPPLPEPSGSTGPTEAANPDGTATAICAAGQSATFPILPPAPTGTAYDPNWCSEQALTIGQQALQIQNQLSAIASLQGQVAAAQKQLLSLGSDSTSTALQAVNGQLAGVLQQASSIGFNTLSAGQAFATAYPSTATTAGFNGGQLASALGAWQSNTALALQNSVEIQNQIARQQGLVTGAIQNAVTASNAAAGSTAASQATNQILAAVSTQLTQLQDILIASSQAYDVAQASAQQASAAAAAASSQTQGQITTTLTAPSGVSNTSSL
ncbi:MAG TPA: Ig-like domain-containing protein [Caulobacteraceae bacterium]|jgi:P-type conjugative transfer protein TrbJ|nr:Ig-like domain-containing protein [Caulobacteraceae bacterium]